MSKKFTTIRNQEKSSFYKENEESVLKDTIFPTAKVAQGTHNGGAMSNSSNLTISIQHRVI